MIDFGLNKVFTTKSGGRNLGTSKRIEEFSIWEDCIEDILEWQEVEYQSFSLMPEHYLNPEIQLIDGDLFLQGRIVTDYKYWCEKFSSLKNEVPRLFVIRQNVETIMCNEKTNFEEFVCGFDLLSSGNVWVGLSRLKEYETISEAFDFITQQIGSDFIICMEEPMQIGKAFD